VPETRRHPSLSGRASQELGREMLAGYDAVLIATAHAGIDYALIAQAAPLVVDTRNVMARQGLPLDRVVKA
jgi:UDP-N-acetyl-D-glucosamine dehydrogenase